MKASISTIVTGVFGICVLASCAYMPDVGKLLPDKKSEYKKSESMPDLEIPPDLTADAINDSMNIPNEAPVTLSRYKNPRSPGQAGVNLATTEADEQLLSLSIPVNLIWPELLEFVESKNYSIALEDVELGVLETGWSEADEQAGLQYRYKYRVFAEAGASADASVLIISQERQTRLDENSDWLEQGKDAGLERQFAADLSLFIGAGGPAAQPAPAVAGATGAATGTLSGSGAGEGLRVVDAGEGKMYLSIPEAVELAWKNTGVALQNSGLQVVGGDQAEAYYMVTGDATQSGEKKGFFSRLAFWKGDKDASWQISLTGVGNKTELIVVNEDDEWEATDEAARILALIRDRYPVN